MRLKITETQARLVEKNAMNVTGSGNKGQDSAIFFVQFLSPPSNAPRGDAKTSNKKNQKNLIFPLIIGENHSIVTRA